jgi:hypothetical protein
LRSDHSEKIHIQKSRKKSKSDFCWILFVMPEDVCIGGILILFVIYRMWWNLNLFVIYSASVQYVCCRLLQFSNGH